MSTINPSAGRAIALLGGILLLVSLFLPWSDVAGETRNGWETLQVWDVFAAITGVCGIVAGLTGGRFGFFRADISFNAMTDMFGVLLSVLLACFLAFDFPDGAGEEIGVWLALVGAATVATGAGDFKPPSLFPARVQPEPSRGGD